ncbi:hypothetical protein COHA_002274 [Chlorella ohadii]|uniref:Uncharacterized protein n=1 Tax=Chlorella ohadii TaxID=2649997 RepID=A0AAD5E0V3_9CHLO|nr:hypothetical protein COHA_002274 [Chlorella ohadii]
MARRLADMLVHPAAGSSQCSPWSPPGRTATQQQKPVAADGLLVGTPSTSAEQLGCKASAAGTAQEPASSSLALPCSRGCPAAPPPPELAWHVAACELERPELRPDPAGGWQQLQQQQLSASSLPPRLRELFVDPSHIEIVSGLRGRLGEGASGYVVKARFQQDVAAAKVFDLSKSRELRSALPLAVLGHLHYDSITDLAWSSDGQYLAISSRDCYCSIAAFDAGELGKPLPASQLPAHIAKRVASAQRMAAPVAMAAPAARTAAAPSAAKAAATPSTAKPATVAEAAAATAAEPASTARQQPEAAVASAPPVVAAAAPAAQRKRIQPEPVSAAPAAGAAGGSAAEAAAPQPGEQPAAKKARRITPETVGPAPAVVGDSQQGGLDLRSYPEPPASAKPVRRITAEPVGAPSGGPGSASGAQPAKPPRRITAEPIGPLPGAAPPSAAKSAGLPAESAVSGKLAKRITPTPLHTADSTGRPFSAAAAANQACAQPAPSEMSRDGCPPASARRITPVPVGAAQALPPGEERTASVAPKPSGIAALAAALGAQAAHQRQQ